MNLRRQFFLIALASCLFGLRANAQDSNQLYKLKAMTSNQSRLSRSEVDSSALGALAPKQAPPQMALAAATQETSVPAIPADNPDVIDKSYMQEYAVDWSGWIARLADRWYYVLRMRSQALKSSKNFGTAAA
ncbi:MAG: hypothetical protein HYX67_02065 [Candidatus Melainabacteria bacterium]|nr:hypothetical protein [Candidatus Melainabacteria bacterium]